MGSIPCGAVLTYRYILFNLLPRPPLAAHVFAAEGVRCRWVCAVSPLAVSVPVAFVCACCPSSENCAESSKTPPRFGERFAFFAAKRSSRDPAAFVCGGLLFAGKRLIKGNGAGAARPLREIIRKPPPNSRSFSELFANFPTTSAR